MVFRVVSKCRVYPDEVSTLGKLKLSVSDLPMLSCHYIQKGVLLTRHPFPISDLLPRLNRALSQALTHFPPLSGRFTTESDGCVFIACNDAGVDFIHADASHISVGDLLEPDVPETTKDLFAFDGIVSYEGHFSPILAVQVTELSDGVFIGCAMNHAVADGTSFWNFFNAFAELSRGAGTISTAPDFSRESVLISPAVLRIPAGGPKVTFSADDTVRERIIRFSRDSILRLKAEINSRKGEDDVAELMGKRSNDALENRNDGKAPPSAEISSFQCLSALVWRCITRARKLASSKTTTFRMAVNCRHRLEPRLEPLYFGNAIQSIRTEATAGEVLSKEIGWCAKQLNKNVLAHEDGRVRRYVEDWERDPQCFPLGNFDGAMITMGSSPRFPMYENDFGWGKPVAIRSGPANKFDGKISAFPGPDGNGSVDLEVVLEPETMAGILSDPEFMHYVSDY